MRFSRSSRYCRLSVCNEVYCDVQSWCVGVKSCTKFSFLLRPTYLQINNLKTQIFGHTVYCTATESVRKLGCWSLYYRIQDWWIGSASPPFCRISGEGNPSWSHSSLATSRLITCDNDGNFGLTNDAGLKFCVFSENVF